MANQEAIKTRKHKVWFSIVAAGNAHKKRLGNWGTHCTETASILHLSVPSLAKAILSYTDYERNLTSLLWKCERIRVLHMTSVSVAVYSQFFYSCTQQWEKKLNMNQSLCCLAICPNLTSFDYDEDILYWFLCHKVYYFCIIIPSHRFFKKHQQILTEYNPNQCQIFYSHRLERPYLCLWLLLFVDFAECSFNNVMVHNFSESPVYYISIPTYSFMANVVLSIS